MKSRLVGNIQKSLSDEEIIECITFMKLFDEDRIQCIQCNVGHMCNTGTKKPLIILSAMFLK